jgi:hypothetical protein
MKMMSPAFNYIQHEFYDQMERASERRDHAELEYFNWQKSHVNGRRLIFSWGRWNGCFDVRAMNHLRSNKVPRDANVDETLPFLSSVQIQV